LTVEVWTRLRIEYKDGSTPRTQEKEHAYNGSTWGPTRREMKYLGIRLGTSHTRLARGGHGITEGQGRGRSGQEAPRSLSLQEPVPHSLIHDPAHGHYRHETSSTRLAATAYVNRSLTGHWTFQGSNYRPCCLDYQEYPHKTYSPSRLVRTVLGGY